MIRPPVAGGVPVKVDESSVQQFKGIKVVWDKGFLGVVADRRWDAIQAAEKLKVEWSDASRRSRTKPHCSIIHQAPVRKREVAARSAMSRRVQVCRARGRGRVQWPFQSHASMEPACALDEIEPGRQCHLLGQLASTLCADRHVLPALGIPLDKGCGRSGCRGPVLTQ